MSSQPTLRLVDRLRGRYVLPVNDGAGPLSGSDVFKREFSTPPIQKEAADRIEDLEKALTAMVERWEPDCSGADRRMWEDACAALAKVRDEAT